MAKKYISPETIENIAESIRKDFLSPDSEDYNGDIYTIAVGLGCKIQIVDFVPNNISARVVRQKGSDNSFTIQISRKDTIKRQKFSIAHEIAHIILHDDDKSEFVELRQNAIEYSEEELYKETQANMLASALLLPKKSVVSAWKSSKSIDVVAEIFEVSTEAAYFRLQNLGLLADE